MLQHFGHLNFFMDVSHFFRYCFEEIWLLELKQWKISEISFQVSSSALEYRDLNVEV